MKPHEQRVVAEKATLDESIARLDVFLRSNPPAAMSLSLRERQLLVEQRHYMHLCSLVLGVRIAEFEPEALPPPPEPGET